MSGGGSLCPLNELTTLLRYWTLVFFSLSVSSSTLESSMSKLRGARVPLPPECQMSTHLDYEVTGKNSSGLVAVDHLQMPVRVRKYEIVLFLMYYLITF